MHRGVDVFIDSLGKVAGKIGVLLDECFTEDETWEAPHATPNALDSVYSMLEQGKLLLKMFFKTIARAVCPMPNQIRYQGISFLRAKGLVTEEEVNHDSQDPTVINDTLIELVLNQCCLNRIISYDKATKLWDEYVADKTNTDAIIDKLWKNMVKGAKGFVGGKVIGWLASWGAVGLMNNGIPVLPAALNPFGDAAIRIPPLSLPKNQLFPVSGKLYHPVAVPEQQKNPAPNSQGAIVVFGAKA